MHLPEQALLGGRLGRLGGELGLGVDVGEWEVAPHEAKVLVIVQLGPGHRLR